MHLIERFFQANLAEFKKLRLDVAHLEAHFASLFEDDVEPKVEAVATDAKQEVVVTEGEVKQAEGEVKSDAAAVTGEVKAVETAATDVSQATEAVEHAA